VIWNETAEKAILAKELWLHVRNDSVGNCIYIGCSEINPILTTTKLSLFKDTQISSYTSQYCLFTFLDPKQPKTVKMDAIVQGILNLSKLEVSLIKIEEATPE
jgi:hypothetical protein